MSFSENFKIKQLGSIEIKSAEIVKLSSNKNGRCYKLRLNNVDSKEFVISDLCKNVQAISNDLVKNHAKFDALRDLIVRLKEADNKTDGSISFCGDFHSDYVEVVFEIQRTLLGVLLEIVNNDDLYGNNDDLYDIDERAKLLLKHENIDLNLQDKSGRTAMMYASASGDKMTVELVSKVISKRDLNIQKEMLKLILLAHSIHKGGLGQVKATEAGREYKSVDLKGINYTYSIKKMSQAIECFSRYPFKSVTQSESLQLSDIFKCSINNFNEENLDRIKKGLPVLLPTGYLGHAVSVLIWGPYFILCNRGESMREGVVEVFKCDPNEFDTEVLDKIRNSRNKNAEAYRKLFFEELPVELDFKPKADQELRLEGICTKLLDKQSTGNCSWASPEGAIFTFFLFNTLLADANGQLTRDQMAEDVSVKCSDIRDKFNEWLVVAQMYELERYLGVEVLRTLSPEKASRNAERRQTIEIDYSVLQSALRTILSNARELPDSDDIISNLKSILVKTLVLTTSGDEEQHRKKAQEMLDSPNALTSDGLKALALEGMFNEG